MGENRGFMGFCCEEKWYWAVLFEEILCEVPFDNLKEKYQWKVYHLKMHCVYWKVIYFVLCAGGCEKNKSRCFLKSTNFHLSLVIFWDLVWFDDSFFFWGDGAPLQDRVWGERLNSWLARLSHPWEGARRVLDAVIFHPKSQEWLADEKAPNLFVCWKIAKTGTLSWEFFRGKKP